MYPFEFAFEFLYNHKKKMPPELKSNPEISTSIKLKESIYTFLYDY